MTNELIERLDRNAKWRNEKWQCVTDPNLLTEASAEIKRLREALQDIITSKGNLAPIIIAEAALKGDSHE
jgi:hypothetical protein